MKLLHFALLSEAIYFIEKLKAVKISSNPKIYKSSSFYILIGGVGKEPTIASLELFFKNYTVDMAFNIGVVGCNSKKVNIGELFFIDKSINLVTVDASQISTNKKELTFYDMEAKYFKEVCFRYLEPNRVKVIKVVSDYLDKPKLSKEFVKSLMVKNYPKIIKATI